MTETELKSTVATDAGKVKTWVLAHAIWVAALAGVIVGYVLKGMV